MSERKRDVQIQSLRVSPVTFFARVSHGHPAR